jgi:hypothetical protein
MTRVIVSVVPPGGNGTTTLIGLEGKACADAASPHAAAQVEIASASTAVQMRANIALRCSASTSIGTGPSVLAFAVASIGRAGYKENR